MARCSLCGTNVFLGGIHEWDQVYCNKTCRDNALRLRKAEKSIPDMVVKEEIAKIRDGLCPQCSGIGPIDLYMSYRVWSILVLTSWRTRQHIACRACAKKYQIRDATYSLLLGWWGFPFGLVITPVQIARNILGMLKSPDHSEANAVLEKLVRTKIAKQMAPDARDLI